MKKPSINVPAADAAVRSFAQAVKENIEIITGRRAGSIASLDSAATTEQIIAKINEMLDRLQG